MLTISRRPTRHLKRSLNDILHPRARHLLDPLHLNIQSHSTPRPNRAFRENWTVEARDGMVIGASVLES
jgi:hypothetical protein